MSTGDKKLLFLAEEINLLLQKIKDGNLDVAIPVQSVNGKIGDVTLSADDVKARPDTWTPSAADVGADSAGTASSAVTEHNTATDAHNDIRLWLSNVETWVKNLLDADDETLNQTSEMIAYMKDNRELVEQITTGKVSVTDIINNLTTNVANKPLSATQGVVLKGLIDALQTAVNAAAKATDLTSHTENTSVHITAAERTKWNQAVTDLDETNEKIADLEETTLKEADRQSIVEDVIDSVIFVEGENPNVHAVYGEVYENNTVILHGTLDEDKNYSFKYEMTDGTTADIGEAIFVPVIEEKIIQCAYIESTDMTSYVDLGYVTTETTGMQVTFELAQAGSYSSVSFFGNSDIACGATAANSDMRAYIGGVKSYQLVTTPAVDTEYTVGVNYQNSGKASIDGTVKNMNSGTKTFQKKDTLTLCKQNGGAQYSRGYYTRIKEAYISEGADVVKHYVPAYRNTDGAIGVLETNSNTFIAGTGNFTKGADVA